MEEGYTVTGSGVKTDTELVNVSKDGTKTKTGVNGVRPREEEREFEYSVTSVTKQVRASLKRKKKSKGPMTQRVVTGEFND